LSGSEGAQAADLPASALAADFAELVDSAIVSDR
jgi:hypothetical protein